MSDFYHTNVLRGRGKRLIVIFWGSGLKRPKKRIVIYVSDRKSEKKQRQEEEVLKQRKEVW